MTNSSLKSFRIIFLNSVPTSELTRGNNILNLIFCNNKNMARNPDVVEKLANSDYEKIKSRMKWTAGYVVKKYLHAML